MNIGKIVTLNPSTSTKRDIDMYRELKIVGFQEPYYSRTFKTFFTARYICEILGGCCKGGKLYVNYNKVVFH